MNENGWAHGTKTFGDITVAAYAASVFISVVFALHFTDHFQTPMCHGGSCMPKIECRTMILKLGGRVFSCETALALALGLAWGIKIYAQSAICRWVAGRLADECFVVLRQLPFAPRTPRRLHRSRLTICMLMLARSGPSVLLKSPCLLVQRLLRRSWAPMLFLSLCQSCRHSTSPSISRCSRTTP